MINQVQTDVQFVKLSKDIVADYVQKELGIPITVDDIYIVWQVKVLQNWKALLSTTIPDTRYYEVTINGDKNEVYLDTYVKEKNKVYEVTFNA